MKILLLADPFIPVPPLHYGGIERVVYDLALKYAEMGHEVTLIAGPNSQSPSRLITYGANGALNHKLDFKLLAQLYPILWKEIKNHDVIHNFGRLIFLAPFLKHRIKKVQTYMRYVGKKNIRYFDLIKPKNLVYTAVSNAIVSTGQTPNSHWETVYNCAPIDKYEFNADPGPDAYLAFLGRIERCKGLHNAITVAKKTNKRLIVAGNIPYLKHELEYFENEIKPQFDDDQIKYIGVVNDEQKNELLRNAAALLSPIEWFEPFPIIIPEAFACGTPVLGFKNGGLPEGIDQGVTGFISTNTEEMAEHVQNIPSLNRKTCREAAETRFSDTVIANNYLDIYNS